ncbi:MAG: TonB C-terminal domain-containing protein [Pseudomonadota bacterium]|nr:TonB C-terminal domain-containing protein [Pseudomonadota bacterium]
MMPGSIMLSSGCHCVAALALYFGMPHLWSDDPVDERVVIVDLVAVAEDRNLPKVTTEPSSDNDVNADSAVVSPPPPPPPPPVSSRPAEAVTAEASVPVVSPPPVPEKVESVRDHSELDLPRDIVPPAVKPKRRTRPSLSVTPPDQETKPDPFASVLKSVEELEETQTTPPDDLEELPSESWSDPIEEILAKADSDFVETAPLSMTELDSIRQQIQKNWKLPAGARDAHNMRVTLKISLGRDGTVLDVIIVDSVQTQTNTFFRAMAESAARAVYKTEKIRYLSPEKYHLWRDLRLNFDPSDMFG